MTEPDPLLDTFVVETASELGAEQAARRAPRSARQIFKVAFDRVQADVRARELIDRKGKKPLTYRDDRV